MLENMSDNLTVALVIMVFAVSTFDIVLMSNAYLFGYGTYAPVIYWVYSFLPVSIFSLLVAGTLFVVYGYRWPNTLSDATMYWISVTWYIVATKFLLQLSFTVVERTML